MTLILSSLFGFLSGLNCPFNLSFISDLISIHVNGFSDPNVYGVKTCCLNSVTDDKAIKTVIAENSLSLKKIQDMDIILGELMQSANVTKSGTLAKKVHNSLLAVLEAKYDNIKNRGIKNAPLYVLLKALMPSIWVQPSFITNKSECERLLTVEYQETISSGVVKRY